MSDAQPSLLNTGGSFRPSDPWTSKQAARRVRYGFGRYKALRSLGDHPGTGRTAYEVAARWRMLMHSANTRLAELVADGYAVPAGTSRPTDTGTPAAVFIITTAGRNELELAEASHPAATSAAQEAPGGSKPAGRPLHPTPGRYGLTTTWERVLEDLYTVGDAGLTDHELGARLGRMTTAVGTERRNLVKRHLVQVTDRTRPTPGGGNAHIAVLTMRGRYYFRALVRPGNAQV